jgi:hypothetical protein
MPLSPGKGSRVRAEVLDEVIGCLMTIRDTKDLLVNEPAVAIAKLQLSGWQVAADPTYGDSLYYSIPYGKGEYRVSFVVQRGQNFLDFREWWSG